MKEPKDVDKVIADAQSLLEAVGFEKPPAKLEQLLAEVENLLKQAPPEPSIRTLTGSEGQIQGPPVAWVGWASAVVSQWNSLRAITFQFAQADFVAQSLAQQVNGYRTIMMILHEAQRDLRLKTVGPLSVAIDKGRVFDYFEELTDIIKQATADLLFVDAYLDDEFISRYLPHAKSGISIRLLTSAGKDPRHLGKLLPAVKLFAYQNNQAVSVRTTAELHDRYLLVDHTRCFSSGASFKDGAKNAGTTIVQLIDIFDPVRDAYEKLWTAGKAEL